MPGIERPKRRTMPISTRPLTEGYEPSRARLRTWNPNKSSLYDVIQNRRKARSLPQTFFLMDEWWSRTGSNRRHPACKAGALPAELRPLFLSLKRRRRYASPWLTRHQARRPSGLRMQRIRTAKSWKVVGLGGLEPPTSRLSSARSNQLSYKPLAELSKSPQIGAKPRKRDCASRLVPRPRGAPAPEGCGTARERRLIIHP